MIVITDTEVLKGKELVATIGFFDGVHRGHRFLIDELKRIAHEVQRPSAVITFSAHPRSVLQADYQPKLLHSFEEKMNRLATTGIDYCIVLDFTLALSKLTAREFIETVLCRQLQVKQLLIGYDHRFGHDRTDGFEQYVAYGARCGMQVLKASEYDEEETAVSSSEIRNLLSQGNVEQAAHLLTAPYQLKGHIVSGYQIGRTLGFPTANIQSDEPCKMIPGIGVYAVKAEIKGEWYAGMLYIGSRPTVNNGPDISMEVNLFNFSDNIYNDTIRISFLHFIRGDIKFNSLDELKKQLQRDRVAVQQIIEEKESCITKQ